MKIENIEKIDEKSWLVETNEKAIAFSGISIEEFVDQLISIINQPERSKREGSSQITNVINDNSKLPKVIFSKDMLTKKTRDAVL